MMKQADSKRKNTKKANGLFFSLFSSSQLAICFFLAFMTFLVSPAQSFCAHFLPVQYVVKNNGSHSDPIKNKNIVNIYGWHEQIPIALLEAFTKETGIAVRYDVLDGNEILEAKLLAGNTGYDVVFPTAWPYVKRQAASGLYMPLQRKWLPDYKQIDADFLKRMEKADPRNEFAIPYTWGLVAIGYNPDLIPKTVKPDALQSWALVYDLKTISSLAANGITLLDDPLDVYTTFYIYQGLNPNDMSRSLLKDMTDRLKTLRPHYRRFGSNLVAEQLGSGELAVVMHWSGILSTARKKFKALNPDVKIEIMLPKEGTTMWIDCIAIPKDAPHPENAHKFINFLLRPENAAQITNAVYTATTIKSAFAFLKPEIKGNKSVFPDDAYMKKVVLPEITSLQHQRFMSRYFASVMTYKPK